MNTYKHIKVPLKVIYHNGQLYSVDVSSTKIDKILWDGVKHSVEFYEDDLNLEMFKEVRTNAPKEKIALFCIGYKAWTLKTTGQELNYKVSKADAGMLKNVKVTEELLRTFLLTEFWTKEKNIANYVKHYNEIQRIAAAKSTGRSADTGSNLDEAFHRRYSK